MSLSYGFGDHHHPESYQAQKAFLAKQILLLEVMIVLQSLDNLQ